MNRSRNIVLLALIVVIALTASGDFLSRTGGTFQTAREADQSGAPTWPINPDFKKDAFTFTRLQYVARHDLYRAGHTEAEDRWVELTEQIESVV